MTLIAAFRCSDGYVIGADSEENYGTFRRSVQKLRPHTIGGMDVLIAGSGIGSLIESFIIRMERTAVRLSTLDELRQRVEGELVNFYARDVATFAAPDDQKQHKFIIAAHDAHGRKSCAWVTQHATLEPVTTFALAGVEDILYDHAAARFYSTSLQVSQGVLVALYVLLLGEATSGYIRSPFKVAIVRDNGIWEEPADRVRLLEERIKRFAETLDSVMLSCADVSIDKDAFQISLEKVTNAILHLRHDYLEAAASELADRINDFTQKTPAYSPIPIGSVFSVGADKSLQVKVTEEMYEVKRLLLDSEKRMTGHVTVRRTKR